jgi:glucose-6-phosphate isomerase
MEVEPGVVTGDYLQGFLRGTRTALYEGGRDSITVSIPEVTPFHVGALIALYERAVGYYGSLVNINPYHQPGVEAGKKAATAVLELQLRTREALRESSSAPQTAAALASRLQTDPEPVYHVLTHLAANDPSIRATHGATGAEDQFNLV